MSEKYLLCPQCGFHRFYIDRDGNNPKYFNVDYANNPIPVKQPNTNLEGEDFSIIYCTACPWSGGLHNLRLIISKE